MPRRLGFSPKTSLPIRDIIFTVIFLACLPACFFRPFWGVLMWTIVSLLNPHAFMWSLGHQYPWALMVAIPTLLGYVCFAFKPKRLLGREVFLMVVLWIWFTFTSVYNSQQPEFLHFATDTWLKWNSVSKTLLMAIVTIGIVDTWERFRTLLLVISGCLGILVVKAIPFMILTGGSFRLYGPPGSSLADNNDFGLALNMTIPLLFFVGRSDPNPRVRKIMMFVFIAMIPAVFFTYSRGALLGLGAVMFFILLRMKQRILLIPIILLAGLFAVFFTPERWQQRMDFRRDGALIDDSAMSRFNAWTYCWRLVQDHPLTGAGFEAFTPQLFDRYAPNPRDVHGPHSVYFGVLAEHGFIGLGLYLTLIFSTFLTLGKQVKFGRAHDDEQIEAYGNGLRVSLVGFMVSGAFLGRAYFDFYFTIVACASILKLLCFTYEREVLENEAALEEQLA
jgi:putative inorganic carbon (hco3(-)) transporter